MMLMRCTDGAGDAFSRVAHGIHMGWVIMSESETRDCGAAVWRVWQRAGRGDAPIGTPGTAYADRARESSNSRRTIKRRTKSIFTFQFSRRTDLRRPTSEFPVRLSTDRMAPHPFSSVATSASTRPIEIAT